MEGIVYFQCNNWSPYPSEAAHFIYDYLEGAIDYPDNDKAVLTTEEEVDRWLVENEVCISTDLYDMSFQYWVTCKKEWLEKNFPELLPYANEEPQDNFIKGDKKFFLKYCPENYGYRCINVDDTEAYEKNKEMFVEF